MKKRGQTLVITAFGILVMLILFVQLFLSEIRQFKDTSPEDIQILNEEAERVADLLTSTPIPFEWTSSNLIKPGLLELESDHIINKSIEKFAKIPYSKTKLILGAKKEYIYFFLDEGEIVKIDGKQYWGYPIPMVDTENGGASLDTALNKIESSRTLGKAQKFVLYKTQANETKTISLQVYLW